jgi:hypothetical protein
MTFTPGSCVRAHALIQASAVKPESNDSTLRVLTPLTTELQPTYDCILNCAYPLVYTQGLLCFKHYPHSSNLLDSGSLSVTPPL